MIRLNRNRSSIWPVIHNRFINLIFLRILQARLSVEFKLIYLNGPNRVHLPLLEGILQQSHIAGFRIQQMGLFETSSLPLIGSSSAIFILIIYALLRLLRQYVPMTMRAQRTYPFVSGGICPYAGFFKACLLCHIAKSG